MVALASDSAARSLVKSATKKTVASHSPAKSAVKASSTPRKTNKTSGTPPSPMVGQYSQEEMVALASDSAARSLVKSATKKTVASHSPVKSAVKASSTPRKTNKTSGTPPSPMVGQYSQEEMVALASDSAARSLVKSATKKTVASHSPVKSAVKASSTPRKTNKTSGTPPSPMVGQYSQEEMVALASDSAARHRTRLPRLVKRKTATKKTVASHSPVKSAVKASSTPRKTNKTSGTPASGSVVKDNKSQTASNDKEDVLLPSALAITPKKESTRTKRSKAMKSPVPSSDSPAAALPTKRARAAKNGSRKN